MSYLQLGGWMSRTPIQDQQSDSGDDQEGDPRSDPRSRWKQGLTSIGKFAAAFTALISAAASIYVGVATFQNEQDEKAAQKVEESEQFARGVTLFRDTGADGTEITLVNRNKERLSDVWIDVKDGRGNAGGEPLLGLLKDEDARIDLDVVKDCSQISIDYLAIFARSKGVKRKPSSKDVTASVIFRDIDGKYWEAQYPYQIFSGPYNDGEVLNITQNVKAVDVKAEEKLTELDERRCR
ncbi:hypothetical protein [Streptomyces griseorubiginosus]|uniref:hypothetical protein n=1 Tax=Streptomyces griseorubiginosus TaxID=67304 RepID=UPI000B2F5982|nr:hypothetical protein [Streptomyces griseorubiginosus]